MLNYVERNVMPTEDAGLHQFAVALKILREGAGLSQRQLAEATGVSEPIIRNLEREEVKKPGIHDVITLAKYFGLTPADVAVLFDLWIDNTTLFNTPKLNNMLNVLDELILHSPPELQDEIADSLDIVLALIIRRNANTLKGMRKPELTQEAIDKLPKFLRDRFTK